MTAYLIADTQITDEREYEQYKIRARPLVEAHGGTYLARGGALTIVDSDLWSPSRIVLISFPDAQAARDLLESPEYQEVAKIRHANARSTLIVVEGE